MIIGSNFIYIKELTSTNTHATELLRLKTLQEGTVIHTSFQSSGRGQTGNSWESEESKNLLFSIVLFPSWLNTSEQFYISMVVSLGITDFLKRYVSGCSIKWPNDIYVKNDKIAGILIENSIMDNTVEYSIAGIGLNINQSIFISKAPNPVSLRLLTGKDHDPDLCLRQVTKDLDRRYKQLITGELTEIKEEYILQLYRLGEWHEFRDQAGIFKGRIKSVNDFGILSVERHDGIKEYSFREIDFIL